MQHAILSIKKLKYNLNTYIVCSDSTNEPTKNTMQPMQPMQTMTPTTIDPVSGLDLLGGIPRMADDIQVDSPKTVECIARAKWYSKFKSDAAASAKFIGRRSKQTTHTSYMPATNPKFSQHVRTMTMSIVPSSAAAEAPAAAAAAAAVDINAVQATILVRGMQSMRIRLLIDPVPKTIVELRELCAETSRIEALAYTTYVDHANRHKVGGFGGGGLGGGCDVNVNGAITYPTYPTYPTQSYSVYELPPPNLLRTPHSTNPLDGACDDDTFLAEYNFVKQTRVDLEIEIQRCQRQSFARNAVNPTPTPHARIAPFHRNMLRNVLSPDTLKRTFVSVPALTVAVGKDIERFLTWESHGPDRLAVVDQIRVALILAEAEMKNKH